MHKLFCIMGRTSSGKTSMTKAVAKELGLKVVQSYTTRPKRKGETKANSDHIFIKEEDVAQYKDDIVAYTEINGYKYFTTTEQLYKNDAYVIDPNGYYFLRDNLEKMRTKGQEEIELIPVYITVSKDKALERAKDRGDDVQAFEQRYMAEDAQFRAFERSDDIRFRVLNHGTFEEGCAKLKGIFERYNG